MGKSLIIPGADFSANGIRVGNVINVVVGETIPFNVYLLPTASTYESAASTYPTVPNDAVLRAVSEDGEIEANSDYASILVGRIAGGAVQEVSEVAINYNGPLDVRQAFMGLYIDMLDLSGINFGSGNVNLSKFCAASKIGTLTMPQINVSDMKYAFYNYQAVADADATPSFAFIKKVSGTMESAFEYYKRKYADVSGIDVSSVTNFQYTFRNSSLEVIDLSTWHIDSATVINGMFNGCSKLKAIHLDNFNCQPGYKLLTFSNTPLLEKVFVTNCSSEVKTYLLTALNNNTAGGASNWTEGTVDGKACLVKGA